MEDWRAMLLNKLPKEKQPRRRYVRQSSKSKTEEQSKYGMKKINKQLNT